VVSESKVRLRLLSRKRPSSTAAASPVAILGGTSWGDQGDERVTAEGDRREKNSCLDCRDDWRCLSAGNRAEDHADACGEGGTSAANAKAAMRAAIA